MSVKHSRLAIRASSLLAGCVALGMAGQAAQAAVVAFDHSTLAVTNLDTAGFGSGYVLYAVNSNAQNLNTGASSASPVDYVSISLGSDNLYGDSSHYPSLTVGGTSYVTGSAYMGLVSAGDQTLATITLGATTPSSFLLGVLVDNSNDAGNNMTSLTVGSGASSVPETIGGAVGTNDFYFFKITGASPSDVITVAGANEGSTVLFGGLTFDPVPEPASLGVLAVGGLGLLARRRQKA